MAPTKNIPLTTLLFTFFYTFCHAQVLLPVELKHPIDSFIDIKGHTTGYIDKSTKLRFADILLDSIADQFRPLDQIKLAARQKRGKYRYWLHFTIRNASSFDSLSFYYRGNTVDSITMYIQDSSGELQEKIAGRWTHGVNGKVEFPFANRINIPLTIPPKTTWTFWVRMMNEYAFNADLRAKLHNNTREIRRFSNSYLTYTAYIRGFFVFLLFLICFTTLQYIQNRDKAFLFYALYILSLLLFYFRGVSYFDHFQHLLPIHFYQYRYHSLFGVSMHICYYFFLAYFIDTKNRYPRFHRFLKALIVVSAVFLVLLQIVKTFDVNDGYYIVLLSRGIIGGIHLLGLIWMLTKRDRLVNLFFIGTVLLYAGSTMTFLEGYLELVNDKWWDADQIFAFIGITAELLFFAMALGYKQWLIQREKSRIESSLRFKEEETDRLRDLDSLKSAFFTNVTHEFRTPLTVIKGMSAEISGNETAKTLIEKNSDQLLQLINQILDLSKAESGNMPMNWSRGDIINHLSYLTESFQSLAFSKNIKLTFYSKLKVLEMDFDADKLRSILVNLIYNAIKFTPVYGQILVVGEREKIEGQPFFILKVIDSGSGIPEAEIPFIFNRFYQPLSSSMTPSEGTGIGLALVKEFTKMHGGTIEVESVIDKGTTFKLSIPISVNAPREEAKQQLVSEHVKGKSLEQERYLSVIETPSDSIDLENEAPRILIIEDNYDVAHYLRTILREDYALTHAKNGEIGIERALTDVPDLIISDVMMPKKDGFEVCSVLKRDERTSHIPIILLTAKASSIDKTEGLQQGADAYLIKPFAKTELLTRVSNLIELRKKLQEKYSGISLESGREDGGSENTESVFLTRVQSCVHQHLDNEDYSIHFLSRQLNLSTSQTYRKIKALTGMSTAVYIRSIRLHYAKQLLKKGELTVSEIAYQVGFKSPSYFSDCFKELFGVAPGAIRK